MALSLRTRTQLRFAFTSAKAADVIADAVDAGSGVISQDIRRRVAAASNPFLADRICDAIAAGQPINGQDTRALAYAMSSYPAAVEIKEALDSL
jgi:hypothetical protein